MNHLLLVPERAVMALMGRRISFQWDDGGGGGPGESQTSFPSSVGGGGWGGGASVGSCGSDGSHHKSASYDGAVSLSALLSRKRANAFPASGTRSGRVRRGGVKIGRRDFTDKFSSLHH